MQGDCVHVIEIEPGERWVHHCACDFVVRPFLWPCVRHFVYACMAKWLLLCIKSTVYVHFNFAIHACHVMIIMPYSRGIDTPHPQTTQRKVELSVLRVLFLWNMYRVYKYFCACSWLHLQGSACECHVNSHVLRVEGHSWTFKYYCRLNTALGFSFVPSFQHFSASHAWQLITSNWNSDSVRSCVANQAATSGVKFNKFTIIQLVIKNTNRRRNISIWSDKTCFLWFAKLKN